MGAPRKRKVTVIPHGIAPCEVEVIESMSRPCLSAYTGIPSFCGQTVNSVVMGAYTQFGPDLLSCFFFPLLLRRVTHTLCIDIPIWLGTVCRRLSRSHLRHAGQQHRHHFRQGHLHHVADWRRRTYAVEGQAERQPPLLMLLCPHQLDMEHGLRLL